jgi:DNA polymerase (family 10)
VQTEEVIDNIKLLSQLMDLHNENPFKVKSLANAAYRLDKAGVNFDGLTFEEIEKWKALGKVWH